MNVGVGVEANPPMGRNVGRNQNIEREDMIAELRRQVVALTYGGGAAYAASS